MIRKILLALVLLAIAIGMGKAFVYGFDKTLDIRENTYYDKEIGRMVYVEKGV